MSPIVHGRIYPETESSGLMGYTLRVLIDPGVLRAHARAMLDIDTLRVYLRTVESPCRITLLLPAKRDGPEMDETYEFMRTIDVEELPSSIVVAPAAAVAFPEAPGDAEALALASTSWFADADIVISKQWRRTRKSSPHSRSSTWSWLTSRGRSTHARYSREAMRSRGAFGSLHG